MNDVSVWRTLTSPAPLPLEKVVTALEELAAAPAKLRLALSGAVVPWLRHDEPRVRLLALSTLAGAKGHAAARWVGERLEDPEPSVRLRAAEVFSTCIREQPFLWIVTLFSADPEVRRAAAAAPPCDEAGWMLLFDWKPGDDAATLLEAMRKSKPPPWAGPLLLRRFGEGRLPHAVIEEAIQAVSVDTIVKVTALEGPESSAPIRGELRRLLSEGTPDCVDQLAGRKALYAHLDSFRLLLEVLLGIEASAELRRELVENIGRRIPKGLEHGYALVLVILLVMRERRQFPADLLALVAVVVPASLTWPWIPAEDRKEVLRRIADELTECEVTGDLNHEDTVRLLRCPELVRQPDGTLDFTLVSRVLVLWEDRELGPALDAFGSELVEAILARPKDAVPLLRFLGGKGCAGNLDLAEAPWRPRPKTQGPARDRRAVGCLGGRGGCCGGRCHRV